MSGIQLDQNAEGLYGKKSYKCTVNGCKQKSSFTRACDLNRHMETSHLKTNAKRGCPYPGSRCKIMADEKRYLTNWYDHILTQHAGYLFLCYNCGKGCTSRKDLNKHFKAMGCEPNKRDDPRKEEDLAERNRCYQAARKDLMSKRTDGAPGAWDDSWAESLSEYEDIKRKKEKKVSKRPPASPTMHLASTSTAPRHRRNPRPRPYPSREGRGALRSRNSVVAWSQQVVVEGSSADLAYPRLSAPSEGFLSQEAHSATRAAPLEGSSHVSSPIVSEHTHCPIGSSDLLFFDARSRGFLTQEGADDLYTSAISNPPNPDPCAPWTSFPAMRLDSTTTASTSTFRPRRHCRSQPHPFLEERATSHSAYSVDRWSQQVTVEGSLADLADPQLLPHFEGFQSREVYSATRATPSEGYTYVSSPFTPAHAYGPVGSSDLLSLDNSRSRGFLTREGADAVAMSNPPNMDLCASWTSSPAMRLNSATTAFDSNAPRPSRHHLSQPYLFLEELTTSHSGYSVDRWSQQVMIEESLADLADPQLSPPTDGFQSREAYSATRETPPKDYPYLSSPTAPAHAYGPVGSSDLLSLDNASSRGLPTQEEAGYLYPSDISNSPNPAPCASRTSNVFWSPSPSLEFTLDSPCSATVLTPPNDPLATSSTDNCLDSPLNAVSPHSLHFSPPPSWYL